jgi:acetylornithine deacetylase/succinyl-diaminopimelate desuccinylase-like protein
VARAVAGAVREVLGAEAEWVASPGSYDQKHIDRIGRLSNCVAYGPVCSSWRTSPTSTSRSTTWSTAPP